MTSLPLYPYTQPGFVDTGTNMTSTGNGADVLGWSQISLDHGANWSWVYSGSGSPGANDALELVGLGGDDILNGRNGNDWFRPGMGDDQVYGDWNATSSKDIVLYDDASVQGVDIDLRITVSQNTIGSGWDTIQDVESVSGSPYDDAIHGNAADNYLFGQDGDDFLWGHAGNDTLEGGGGSDVLEGGGGDDVIWGSYYYDAGAPDTASYSEAGSGVTVSLAISGPQNTGGAGTDTIFEIDNLTGSAFNDTLTGNDYANTLDGGDGDDILKGGLGIDTLVGGTGRDTADYFSAAAAVFVNLAVGLASGDGGTDILSSIEVAVGSNGFGDTLTSAPISDELQGWGGNDTLFASAGNDRLDGGGGTDTVDYDSLGNGVTVALGSGSANKGQYGFDTLVSIENAYGSEYDDTITGTTAANTLRGEGGNDHLTGDLGNDTLHGGSGIDTAVYTFAAAAVTVNLATGSATGGAGTDTLQFIENVDGTLLYNDTLTGDANANRLFGSGGNDTLKGGLGNDTLDGGTGTDTVDYTAATATVSVSLYGGYATGADGTDTLVSIENALGSAYKDSLFGTTGDNVLEGRDGDDLLVGYAGNDTFKGGGANDTVNYFSSAAAVVASLTTGTATGEGSDTFNSIENLTGSGFFGDTLTGDGQVNILQGSGGDDTLSGLGGIDTLDGGTGNDILIGGLGNDILDGGYDGTNDRVSYVNAIDVVTVNLVTGVVTGPDGADTLIGIEGVIGGAYNDVFTGNGMDNVLDGQGGYDELNGGAGNDTLLGGTSDDILRGDAGNDTLDGQGGTGDLASWFNDPGGVTADLLAGTATDGYGNTDTLLRVEWLSGANGYSNTLSGDNGANTINAWTGADRITGRGGADILQGGTNADRFVYLATTDAPVGETITDFVSGSGDLVDLSAIDPSAAAGDQAFAFIGTGTFSGTGTAQVRFSGGTVQADSNGDGIADMTISMTGVVAMVAGDFVL